jgi:hypothetical protein
MAEMLEVDKAECARRTALVATDLAPKALQPGLTREELAAALKDHVKGSAGLVTRFKHP